MSQIPGAWGGLSFYSGVGVSMRTLVCIPHTYIKTRHGGQVLITSVSGGHWDKQILELTGWPGELTW